MAKLLFTHSYFYKYDAKQWEAAQAYPPYGTILAAAHLREQGHMVQLWDSNLMDAHHQIKEAIEGFQPDYLIIYDDGFNYLTKMCLSVMREACFDMCAYGKEAGIPVLVSSSDSSDHSPKYLEAGADIVLIGESEISLSETIEALENKQGLAQIPGIAYREKGKTHLNPKRPILKDLDQFPLPAWDLVNIEAYRRIWLKRRNYFALNIATTRGCPFKCNWCAKPIYGNRYHSRSPEKVAQEISFLMRSYEVENFWICDDIFGLKPQWVQEFRNELKSLEIKPRFKIQSRVDLLLKEDTIEALAEAGLDEVWVGAESGSQKILDAMDKGTKVEEIYEATRLLKANGIKVAFFLQFGYLGETKADIQKTIAMVKELLPDDIGISVSYPLPKTKFYEKVKSQMQDKQNWKDSDDLDMMYMATYPPAFYKRLHRYVHRVYRRAKYYQHLQKRPSLRAIIGLVANTVFERVEAFKLKKLEKNGAGL